MKLHEIIAINDSGNNDSLLIELLIPYKNSLLTYYKDYFCSDPIVMVTMVSNAVQYGIIVSSNDFAEAFECYVESQNLDSEEDKEMSRETISFNSIMLSQL